MNEELRRAIESYKKYKEEIDAARKEKDKLNLATAQCQEKIEGLENVLENTQVAILQACATTDTHPDLWKKVKRS